LRFALTAFGIEWEEQAAITWQTRLGLRMRGRSGLAALKAGTTEKKNANKAVAQELYPSVNVTHAIADALLLAEVAIQRYGEISRGLG
jgi:hypothetical protein